MHDINRNLDGNKTGLTIALCITLSIMIVEFIGGIFTNSLALLSDAGHMLSDSSSLLLSLVAFKFATRRKTPQKTYGYYRFEVLAALFNGLTLFVIAIWIVVEAYERMIHSPTVASGTMMAIAAIGLVANLLSAFALLKKADIKDNLNVRSAYLHIVGDTLGSAGAIFAGFLMMKFNWFIADPIISVLVALLILKSAYGVLQSSLHILMEGAPSNIDHNAVYNKLISLDGVIDIHELHIWSITSGYDVLTCHLIIKHGLDEQDVLGKSGKLLHDQFHIHHYTIQIETAKTHHQHA